jgi:predicted TIM-barrel fold metal-dependent hydrolase
MFESNFPVDKISYSYQVFWNACKLLAKGASVVEKTDLFAGTAARCIGWMESFDGAAESQAPCV